MEHLIEYHLIRIRQIVPPLTFIDRKGIVLLYRVVPLSDIVQTSVSFLLPVLKVSIVSENVSWTHVGYLIIGIVQHTVFIFGIQGLFVSIIGLTVFVKTDLSFFMEKTVLYLPDVVE